MSPAGAGQRRTAAPTEHLDTFGFDCRSFGVQGLAYRSRDVPLYKKVLNRDGTGGGGEGSIIPMKEC